MAKKLLVITFFFPPSAKAGAHRAISLAQFLPQHGWDPIFIAPLEDQYYGIPKRRDQNLVNILNNSEIHRIPFNMPFQKGELHSFARATRKIVETFIPPDSRLVWNVSIKKQLDHIILKHDIDAILISASPFSSFLLAPYIKQRFNLPVILDYRDPWTGNREMEKTILRKWTNHVFEMEAIASADLITTASYYMIDFISSNISEGLDHKSFFPFPYGFDKRFFDMKIKSLKINKQSNYKGIFAGSVHGEHHVETLLNAIGQVVKRQPANINFEILSYGTLFGSSKNINLLINKYKLEDTVHAHPFLSYDEFVSKILEADFLIMPHGDSSLARVLFPTKFFDYIGARRPILYIGGDGQVWDTIHYLNAGICVRPDSQQIADGIIEICLKGQDYYYKPDLTAKFDREIIIKNFSDRLHLLI